MSSAVRSESIERGDAEEGEKLLHQPEVIPDKTVRAHVRAHRGKVKILLVILAALCVGLVSFSAGLLFGLQAQRTSSAKGSPGNAQAVPQVPVRTELKTFQLDTSFTSVPEHGKTEPAWDSLLPNGLGYVNNTELAPDFSVVSVFHQLHCLYTLRRAYYAEQSDHDGLEDFDFGLERNKHAGHCFEYLRQSLMCSADSSIEPAHVKKTDGQEFLGWDVSRTCRSYDQLKQWAGERRAFDAHGFLASDLNGPNHGQ
ncbi:uncharacterized protein RCC_09446 [Ramularia collo-cygni]|uniref:Tat pathway signal sequence n=1 Tax=Ramularia collo-cygni TaxID=112498 RepID=A0A2D3VF38_9PEZI|nr:uncharacterized protein RCC_09446 [Ramularia collo-cygni]CZT23732.1 uncharacterized protein RCC_09446 [Ramularia collo-cygni]